MRRRRCRLYSKLSCDIARAAAYQVARDPAYLGESTSAPVSVARTLIPF